MIYWWIFIIIFDVYGTIALYTNTRFNHSELDLNKNILKGDLVRVFSISQNNDLEEISFISHKIKRKQNLSEISSIYGVSKTLILKYNSGVNISRNNILKIPRVVKSNSPTEDRLKPFLPARANFSQRHLVFVVDFDICLHISSAFLLELSAYPGSS